MTATQPIVVPPPVTPSNRIWDRDLINRYDLSGPRYTSYPTAPQFSDAVTKADYFAAIERSNRAGRPLSLYFHIPFCDTVCYYCACNKVITANKRRARPYLDNIFQEMVMIAPKIDTARSVDQLHWGGGTPTYLSHDEISDLMYLTRRLFTLKDDDSGEYSIEVHPGRMKTDTISLLREVGFNRLSMGVQDFNPAVQKAVNRFNSVEEVASLLARAREEQFSSVSMDLIYGLPLQTVSSVANTIDQVIDLSPDRLSVFNYAHMPDLFKTQRQINVNDLPTPEEKLMMLEQIIHHLTSAGYVYIGMDHFAKPDDELAVAQKEGTLHRNFQGYSTHDQCDMLSFGVSSISAVDDIFVQNHKHLDDYSAAVESQQLPIAKGFSLSTDDRLRQHIIKTLVCQFSIHFETIEQQFFIRFSDYFSDELEALSVLAEDGLVSIHADRLDVLPAGRLLVRRVCMVFDAYLKKSHQARYSKII